MYTTRVAVMLLIGHRAYDRSNVPQQSNTNRNIMNYITRCHTMVPVMLITEKPPAAQLYRVSAQ